MKFRRNTTKINRDLSATKDIDKEILVNAEKG
jgi:hypothetical protein